MTPELKNEVMKEVRRNGPRNKARLALRSGMAQIERIAAGTFDVIELRAAEFATIDAILAELGLGGAVGGGEADAGAAADGHDMDHADAGGLGEGDQQLPENSGQGGSDQE